LSIFNNKVIAAFCGLIVLDNLNGRGNTELGNIISKIARTHSVKKYHKFLKTVKMVVEEHLKITFPNTNKNIHIHFVRRREKDGRFEFRKLSFLCTPSRIKLKREVFVSSDSRTLNGDDNAWSTANTYLGIYAIPPTVAGIITLNETALNNGIAASGMNKAGIPTCGGTLYHQILM
jgi:hypothetical protein